jgi:hypothetical protein
MLVNRSLCEEWQFDGVDEERTFPYVQDDRGGRASFPFAMLSIAKNLSSSVRPWGLIIPRAKLSPARKSGARYCATGDATGVPAMAVNAAMFSANLCNRPPPASTT